MKKEIVTGKQAWEFVEGRKTRNLLGLDFMDYASVFLADGVDREVVQLTLDLQEGQCFAEFVTANKFEIVIECKGAKHIMMQLYCGSNFTLMMEDMNVLNEIVEAISDTEFTWGLEPIVTDEYKLQLVVFVIR